MHSIRSRAARPGYSLMEVAMVLAIISLIVAAALMAFANANDASKTNDTLTELAAVVAAAHALGQGQAGYDFLSGKVLDDSKMLPAKWVSNGNVVDPYGHALVFYPVEQYINVWLTDLPRSACEKIATADLGSLSVSRNVNGQAESQGQPYTPDAAERFCLDGANNIGFNFE